MKIKKIRNGVFETNSSSTHSISFGRWPSTGSETTITPDPDDIIRLGGRNFGWGWESHNDPETKAKYAIAENKDNPDKIDLIKDVIEDWTGYPVELEEDLEDYYIDHQSRGTLEAKTRDEFKEFIFNPAVWLYIGNDNSEEPDDLRYQEIMMTPGRHYKTVVSFPDGSEKEIITAGYPEPSDFQEKLESIHVGGQWYILTEIDLENNMLVLEEEYAGNSKIRAKVTEINELG